MATKKNKKQHAKSKSKSTSKLKLKPKLKPNHMNQKPLNKPNKKGEKSGITGGGKKGTSQKGTSQKGGLPPGSSDGTIPALLNDIVGILESTFNTLKYSVETIVDVVDLPGDIGKAVSEKSAPNRADIVLDPPSKKN